MDKALKNKLNILKNEDAKKINDYFASSFYVDFPKEKAYNDKDKKVLEYLSESFIEIDMESLKKPLNKEKILEVINKAIDLLE